MIPFSILDLCPVPEGSNAGQALRHTIDLAQHAEALGYRRYWLAEHHNMPGIASAATSVALAYVAQATERIRVGSGGVMLPNHAPLVIAEQFGTLAALHPGRIDLGLGRAPGTDQRTMRALRRKQDGGVDDFPYDVRELQAFLGPVRESAPVQAVPGGGSEIPIWLLGSSLYSAQLAARLGLPFAFASHFAPDYLHQALESYRSEFEPSDQLERPYAMAAMNVFAADTEAEGRRLFTSMQQAFLNLRSGRPGKLPAPVDSMEPLWSPIERAQVSHSLRYSAVGDQAQVRSQIAAFIADTGIDELMVTGNIFDHAARRRSFEIAAEARAAPATGE